MEPIFFCGWIDLSDLCQDIDVSAAPPAIDAGQVTYVASGWIGGSNTSASITYLLLPNYALTDVEHSGTLPAKTRRVRIEIDFPASDSLADDIGFTLCAPSAAPVLTPGVVSASAFGGFSAIAPGSWIEIYGDNLSSGAAQQWSLSQFTNGVAPRALNEVTIRSVAWPRILTT